MEHDHKPDFYQCVYLVLAAIPSGKVVTYGEIARLAGFPRSARRVGKLLKQLPPESQLPWHRVINHSGKIALSGPDFTRQSEALIAEGVEVSAQGKIALNRYRWQP